MISNTYRVVNISTISYQDQNPGTSGLRKKVVHFKQINYIENFIQSTFNAHKSSDYLNKSLIVGGDGRFYNDVAINKIIKIAAANGIRTIILAENGIMSTPAISLLIRNQIDNCFGAFILTASHNPGGEHEDLGIKFNNSSGAPAPENITTKIFECSKEILIYKTLDYDGDYSFIQNSEFKIIHEDDSTSDFIIKIESSTALYVNKMQELFDFELIKTLFARKDFKFVFDAMHGVSGPYAIELFNKILGVDSNNLYNCNILPDFGGLHPDPNLAYAKCLVEKMDIHKSNTNIENIPDFGAACDGDADRNMILGKRFFMSPSDSLAIIVANYRSIKNLNTGILGVARSMPTSGALDRVAKKMGIKLYETPTGWKFFGNLMDAGLVNVCGEESFGTGSDHIREKDGMWAVLCWLSIIADRNKNNLGQLVGVRDIALDHWKTYGRDYYCRFDYEGLTSFQSTEVISNLNLNFDYFNNLKDGNKASIFEYYDLVDHSVSKNQGWIYCFHNGSRIIFRFSGTSSSGATIRIYFEKHVDDEKLLDLDVYEMIKSEDNNLVELALKISKIHDVTERTGPTVIT